MVENGLPDRCYCMDSLRILYSFGVMPVYFLNCRRKVLTLLIPTMAPISTTRSLGSASSSTAF